MSIINADNKEIVLKILQENDTFLFDCDGVLWSTGHIFEGAVETIKKLHELGKRVLFVTNNSTKTRNQYLEKITQYGIEAKLEDIYCTGYTTALYLKQKLNENDEVYLMGSEGVGTELDNAGIKHFGIGPDNMITNLQTVLSIPLNPNVKAVVTGFDGHFSYSKVTKATSYLAKKGMLFVATNMDAQFPLKNCEYVLPGTGALINSVITAAGRQPDVICGKPDTHMMDCIKAETDFDCRKAIMIGDRLDTDVLFGKNSNLQTLVVMTGVTTHELLAKIQQGDDAASKRMLPDYFLESISDLRKHL